MRKVSIISDVQFAGKDSEKESVLRQFSFAKEYGAEVKIVTDNYFNRLPTNCSHQSAKHRIEFEGPNVFDYEPGFLESIKDSEVVIAHYSAVNKKMIESLPELKMIGIMRSGIENVDLAAAESRNIIVCNSPGRVSEPVADYTVSLILAFNRNVSGHDLVHKKEYIRDVSFVPPLLRDMTVGIIGFGIIGQKVAKRLSGFGCRLVAYDPCLNETAAKNLKVESVTLTELMKISDCITVHARFTEETRNLVGRSQIALMKADAYIVNTARSRLIDEDALIDAVRAKRIRGAALDVYNNEPLPADSPFYQLDNVLLSPHIAGTAGNWTDLTIAAMKEELKNYLSGAKLKYRVNKK